MTVASDTAAPLCVLITRPLDDALALADRLQAEGFRPMIDPMMQVDLFSGPDLDLTGVQAIAVTSANGVRALIKRTNHRDLPVFAVGEASANQARAAGFTSVTASGGNVQRLTADIAAALDPEQGAIFHGAGLSLAGDLKGNLETNGFSVRKETLYKTVAAESFAPATLAAIDKGAIDAVLFYSPRTGRIFTGLITNANLSAACEQLEAVCLSTAVTETIRDLPWSKIAVADAPNENAVVALLQSMLQGC